MCGWDFALITVFWLQYELWVAHRSIILVIYRSYSLLLHATSRNWKWSGNYRLRLLTIHTYIHACIRTIYLDAVQHFFDELDPGVLVWHLLHLHHLTTRNQAEIQRNHQHHNGKSSKDGRPHDEVEEDKGEDNLKRSWPDVVNVGHQLLHPLCVHGHQVDYLSHCVGTMSLAAQTKSLQENE